MGAVSTVGTISAMGVISLAKPDLSTKHEGLVASLHYILHPPRAVELGGARGAQFLTFTRGRFVRIISCFASFHASPPDRISVPPPLVPTVDGVWTIAPWKLRTQLRLCWGQILYSFVLRPSPFYLLFAFNNARERKTSKKQGRPGSIHHVSDVKWTRGGCKGADIPICNILNLKASFLPVMTSGFNHANVCSPKLQ